MKKGDGPNPGVEFFYKLSLNAAFQSDLTTARKMLGITLGERPDIKTEAGREFWEDKIMDVLTVMANLKMKYDIPEAYWSNFLEDYIFFGTAIVAKSEMPRVAVIDWLSPRQKELKLGDIESWYRKSKEPYVKMFVLRNATKTSLKRFIDDNWRSIREELIARDGDKKRVRETVHKERNQRIRELYHRPTHELRKLANDPQGKYKYSLIRKVLKQEGFGLVSEGYIRKIGGQK